MKKVFLAMAAMFSIVGLYEVSIAGPKYRTEFIQCGSENYKYRECSASSVRMVMEARLSQQHSKTSCRKGSTWGYGRQGVWVDKGCRGTFEVSGVSL